MAVVAPAQSGRAAGATYRALAVAQGVYYLGAGLWPLVDLRSFERWTGPKPEGWLAKTVGALVATEGAAFVAAAFRKRPEPTLAMLAGATALALAGVDIAYAQKGRISPVYLLDAAPEILLGALWILWLAATRGGTLTRPAAVPDA